ncbi:outer membrane protein [Massilia violaceinigra]|uniref:outer membrane protein n=1 Tax=Massilia violaceinigra TaxID=2045208 RepID=UPI001FB1F274|nr:outer membrane beta-barrel protein [Massilia violaceinigra]
MTKRTTGRGIALATALAASLLVLAPATAADQDAPANYWGAHLGANTLRQLNASVDFGFGTAIDGRAELKRGLHGGLQVGRQSGHGRYELEYERGRIRVQRLTLEPLSEAVDGSGRYDAAFANAYRTDRLGTALDSFVGGGIGWGRVKLPQLKLGEACACFGPASKNGVAWQLRAGLLYRFSESDSIALQYSWLHLPQPRRHGDPDVQYERPRLGALTLGYLHQFH